ncbi:MAG: RING finger protein [Planctomycetota bacterium]
MTEPQAKQVQRLEQFEAGTKTAGKLCAICQTVIVAGERIVYCPHCALPFHDECWQENQGCSAYGCAGAPKTAKAQAGALPVTNAWGGEKRCPACGKSIKAEALKCRFCGAAFDTRDVIAKEEYASRDYEGTEYAAARNKVVLLFLLSAAGCLAPLGLILATVLVSTKHLMGIDYQRLPAALKAVLWSAVGVGCLMILIGAMLIILD